MHRYQPLTNLSYHHLATAVPPRHTTPAECHDSWASPDTVHSTFSHLGVIGRIGRHSREGAADIC
ncbi:hypothetical protein CPB85DRAFT_1298024 [Mucidula mucida]|nr:hypothetical protein CPB85DRAFT_1298024 [Mucidula mucida]